MIKVLNTRPVGKSPALDRVYVGRPSKCGNPFVGRDGPHDDVIAKDRAWIMQQPALMAVLHELRGKNDDKPEAHRRFAGRRLERCAETCLECSSCLPRRRWRFTSAGSTFVRRTWEWRESLIDLLF